MAAKIRATRPRDILNLAGINATFVSSTVLRATKQASGIQAGWQLVEEALSEPYDKGKAYNLVQRDLDDIRARLPRSDCAELVAEDEGRLVAVYDLETLHWNNTGWLWNLLVDAGYRRQGIGRALFQRGVSWARKRNLRALLVETQTNNVPACRFYERMGCHLVGINDHYYTNRDLEAGEVAIFWAYDLSDTAPDAFSQR